MIGEQETVYGPVEIVLTSSFHVLMCYLVCFPLLESSVFIDGFHTGCDSIGLRICALQELYLESDGTVM